MSYAPHTEADIAAMLDRIGLESLDALFAHLPAELARTSPLDLPAGRSEDEILRHLGDLARRNDTAPVCFAGAGAYDHVVPSAVAAIISRGELLTAYTPYQPEVSQGLLQALFEYQTVVSELTGLPVANASLYDGGSAVAEAVSMAVAATRRNVAIVSDGLDHPSQQIVRTYGHPVGRHIVSLDLDERVGVTSADDVGASQAEAAPAVVVIQQPNRLGVIEDVRAIAEAAHGVGAMLVVKLDPTVTGLVARPGDQGADVVVGEGQPFGQGRVFGGPTVGFLACTRDQVRRVPGRIVGRTVDVDGTTGYVMTLRAREQDIRRERATSNICTNQTLNAVAFLVHAAWLGPQGLVDLAQACLARTHDAIRRLEALPGLRRAVDGPVFKEFVLRTGADPDRLVDAVHRRGYLVGPVVEVPGGSRGIVVAVTERRTLAQVEGLVAAFADALQEVGEPHASREDAA